METFQFHLRNTFQMFHKCVCWLQCSKIDPDLEMFLKCSHSFLGTLAPSEKSRKDQPHQKSRSRERQRSRRRDRPAERRDRYRLGRNEVRRERKFEPPKDRKRDNKGKGLNPNVICFACQQRGHYASDPACPMYGKRDGPALRDRPQVRAARAGRGENSSSGDETTTNLGDGSQSLGARAYGNQ